MMYNNLINVVFQEQSTEGSPEHLTTIDLKVSTAAYLSFVYALQYSCTLSAVLAQLYEYYKNINLLFYIVWRQAVT